MLSENNVEGIHNNNIKIVIFSTVVFIIIASISTYSFLKNKAPVITTSTSTDVLPFEPKKTDFGTTTPTDFPTDIPVENGLNLEQSYSLNYTGQKQLTIVFLSIKTVKENYALYANYLSKNDWNVLNKYEDVKISSLYATKEGNEINVTIIEDISTSTKSKVSLSVLKNNENN